MVALAGNRCGFDSGAPRFHQAPETIRPLPRVLRECQVRIRDYFSNPALFPSLAGVRRRVRGHLVDRQRDQRGERREACCALLAALVQHMDLVSMRVGRPVEGGDWEGVTLADLAREAGLGLRRAERASADLVAAGLVTVHQVATETDAGELRGLAAIRTLAADLFGALGLGTWLSRERGKAYRRAGKRTSEQQTARGRLAMQATRLRVAEGNADAIRGRVERIRAKARQRTHGPPGPPESKQ